jgi:SagB-type dehydrogenase family enzyme
MTDSRVATVLAYHARSKHALDRYAAGPATLDWEAQPKAFRDWTGAAQSSLPRDVVVADISWGALPVARPTLPLNTANLGSFLRLCVGLTAWKEYAGSRWSLRAHPSSGNLHPTETWLIAAGVAGLEDGLYHYQNLHHALERRAWGNAPHAAGAWIGFTSIHWREAWKYGERAFRYCQLDMGHVLAAVCYAAALHGWHLRLLSMDSNAVAHSLGLDREADFAGVEGEEPEVIIALEAGDEALPSNWQHWAGKPSLLDARPLYQWPVIEEVADATRGKPPAVELNPNSSLALRSLLPPCRGKVAPARGRPWLYGAEAPTTHAQMGVGSGGWQHFQPHPNPPPAWGRECFRNELRKELWQTLPELPEAARLMNPPSLPP